MDKIFTKSDGTEYYMLNKDNKKIYKKELIEKELSNYSSFKEVGTLFDIVIEGNELIEINKTKYDKISGLVKDNGKIKFYLCRGRLKKEVKYEYLLKNLRTSKNGEEALKTLNQTLAGLEKMGLI